MMHTLEQKIKAYDEQKQRQVPAPVLALMEESTRSLQASGLEQGALGRGERMPDFALPDQHGVVRPLSHYLAEGPVLLNVYRGGWCPYCNMEMQALNAVLPALRERGVNLIGMTPETPSSAQDTLTANRLAITVLSDEGNRVSAALGLVFELPEALRPMSFTLPVPASYIIGQDRTVLYHFINADYTRRVEPAALLAELDRLAKAGAL